MTPALPTVEAIRTERLVLEPLRVRHADEMAPLLDDERLHEFIGGRPLTPDQLRARYARLAAGGHNGWFNWVVRCCGVAVGTVQATVEGAAADVAWVVGTGHQRKGYATEAARGVVGWLGEHGIRQPGAAIHPGNHASAAVARKLGLVPTDVVDDDGEVRWVSAAP
ncbi:GNAT family N-acetyltransferase [Umezawaea tangerina]|uniref:RimJ/RimL family protein N-acetyltransferase n=1 Tax=Umezawaea tangerina TaxID=84725 RepID=A0A2T0TLI8_9PSEU|nr:GNAT family N-acetyltransferase [Umezawaea tangerina]PRY46388.1 RimJ/RimL family protein N-acetyltransferase [Umezawaea tangerina]